MIPTLADAGTLYVVPQPIAETAQTRDNQTRDNQTRDNQTRDNQARDNQARDNQARDTLSLPEAVWERAALLKVWAGENLKPMRRFVVEARKRANNWDKDLSDTLLQVVKHPKDIQPLLARLLAGEDAGLVSDAGCPGIADPGAPLIAVAHELGVQVVPLVGPASPVLALMSSGLNGQSFTFHGYLPVQRPDRKKALKKLEHDALQSGYTQLFIETPYRNDAMLEDALQGLRPTTWLHVSVDATSAGAKHLTRSVAQWQERQEDPTRKWELGKRPAVFALGPEPQQFERWLAAAFHAAE